MKLYVGGPMRGHENFNFPAFWEAAKTLRTLGHEIDSPAEFDVELGYATVTCDNSNHPEVPLIAPHEFAWGVTSDCKPVVHDTGVADITKMLRKDYKAIVDGDGIALLPGWEKSTGARGETRVALETGRAVFLYWNTDNDEDIGDNHPLYPADLDYVRDVVYGQADVPAVRAANGQRKQGEEVRIVDPVTGGAKGSKDVQFARLPKSIEQLARHFTFGAQKYPDVEPGRANWSLGYNWTLSYNAMMRHAWAWIYGEDIDDEFGQNHLIAVAWHALVLAEMQTEGLGTDDRPVHTADRRSN